jgi:hypothetical protein
MNDEIRETHREIISRPQLLLRPYHYDFRDSFSWYVRAMLYFRPLKTAYNKAENEHCAYKELFGQTYVLAVWRNSPSLPVVNCRCKIRI